MKKLFLGFIFSFLFPIFTFTETWSPWINLTNSGRGIIVIDNFETELPEMWDIMVTGNVPYKLTNLEVLNENQVFMVQSSTNNFKSDYRFSVRLTRYFNPPVSHMILSLDYYRNLIWGNELNIIINNPQIQTINEIWELSYNPQKSLIVDSGDWGYYYYETSTQFTNFINSVTIMVKNVTMDNFSYLDNIKIYAE